MIQQPLKSDVSRQVAPLGAYTTTGYTSPFNCAEIDEIEIDLRISSVSGAAPTLQVWLETSPDDGDNWYKAAYDNQLDIGASTADVLANANRTNIEGLSPAGTSSAGHQYRTLYQEFPADLARVRWAILGASASFTFELWAKGKGE